MSDAPVTIWMENNANNLHKNTQSFDVWHEPNLDGSSIQYTRTDTIGWNADMEAAPREGTRFLAYWPDSIDNESECVVTTWGFGERWHNPFEDVPIDHPSAPTKWMHLPPE
jgi:hypothetical protein